VKENFIGLSESYLTTTRERYDSMVDVEKQYDATMPDHGAKDSDEIGRQLDGVDPVYEAKIVRKLDLYIIPVVMLLYLFSFLDR
jgi:hypothetical protein